jgi:ParB family transcriptional regulator, chromosome partitioning protein
MTERTTYLQTKSIEANPENPRLVFREKELQSLQQSIAEQGILVPLTVFRDGSRYKILDGERRWRCALRLNLAKVPVIIQEKPEKLQNIMMMFAIHNTRRDWDPLPTALKLRQLEGLLQRRTSKRILERTLAAHASITVGEVRRLKRILELPPDLLKELRQEGRKELSDQTLTVDQVVETADAARALQRRDVVSPDEATVLVRALVDRFRRGEIKSTVEPRLLVRLAQAVGRGQVGVQLAHRVVSRLSTEPGFTIENAYKESVAQADFEHGVDQIASRLTGQLAEFETRSYRLTPALRGTLRELRERLERLGV